MKIFIIYRNKTLKLSEVCKFESFGDEPEGARLAEISFIYNDPQCCGPAHEERHEEPHEERHAKVSKAETQFCQNM